MRYSVIIPVYNAEKTLNRCVDSLLAENYPDCEIILVNDGSKDRSGEICHDYAERFPNIVYIEKENGGVSTARNAGLDHARGEYVVFVDSDDYVTPGFFSSVEAGQKKNRADWSFFSSCIDDGMVKKTLFSKSASYTSRTAVMPVIIDAICRKTINGPHAKVFRRDIIEKHGIRFPVGVSVAEDRAFNICYSLYVNSLEVYDLIVYCVNTENKQSLSRKRHTDLDKQFGIADSYLDDSLQKAPNSEKEKEQYRRALNFGSCRSIYHDAKLMHKDRVNWLERQKRLGQLCDRINRRHMKYPSTRYCLLISLPVRLRVTTVIDYIAWKLCR